MSDFLRFIRGQAPELKDVPDKDLVRFLGDIAPEIRDASPEFDQQYRDVTGVELRGELLRMQPEVERSRAAVEVLGKPNEPGEDTPSPPLRERLDFSQPRQPDDLYLGEDPDPAVEQGIEQGVQRMQTLGRRAATGIDKPSLEKLDAQIGLGRAMGRESFRLQGAALLEAAADTVNKIGVSIGMKDPLEPSTLKELGAINTEEAQQNLEELEELSLGVGGGSKLQTAREFTQTATASAPSIGGAKLGINAASIIAGLQQAGGVYQEAKKSYIEQGDDPATAGNKALFDGAISGMVTRHVTKAFGPTGAEALARGMTATSVKGLLQNVYRGVASEAVEEGLDQVGQGIVAKARFNPEMGLDEIITQTFKASAMGGALGGFVQGIVSATAGAIDVLSKNRKPPEPEPAEPEDLTGQFAKEQAEGAPAEPEEPAQTEPRPTVEQMQATGTKPLAIDEDTGPQFDLTQDEVFARTDGTKTKDRFDPTEAQDFLDPTNIIARPIELPELVALARNLLGSTPSVRKLKESIRGYFHPKMEKIVMNALSANNSHELAKVLAHEIGHAIDWLPDRTLARGNILGRIAALRGNMKQFMPDSPGAKGQPLTDAEKERLRRLARQRASSTYEIEIEEEIYEETPITPQDILNIWNSVVAPNLPEALLNYVKGLSTADKKSVVKDAIKGVVPDELKQFASRIATGQTRKTKKTVTKEATKKDIQAEFERLVMDEIRTRMLWDEKELRREAIQFSKYWRPYDETTASPSWLKYRLSSKELMADMLSGWLNSPGDLQKRAPSFFNAWMNYLGNRPEVAEQYLTLQDLLRGDPEQLIEMRRRDIREDAEEGSRRVMARIKEEEAKKRSLRQWVMSHLMDLKQLFIDKKAPLILREKQVRKKTGRDIPQAQAATSYLEELDLGANRMNEILTNLETFVHFPMKDAGIGESDMHEFLFYNRVINERDTLANPRGHTEKTARESLEHMEKAMGREKYRKLVEFSRKFHDIIFTEVERAVELGTYNKKLFEEKILPNKYAYATFQVLDYIDENIPATIKKQVGTFKEVGNTYHSTVMKTLALTRLNNFQEAKLGVLDFLYRNFPQEVERTALTKFKREPKPKKGWDNMFVLEDGKPVIYTLPEEIVDSFKNHEIGRLQRIARFIQSSTYRIFHPLFVTFNPAFTTRNLYRDLKRTWINLGSVANTSLREVLSAYIRSIPAAKRRAWGEYDPVIARMLEEKALDIPFTRFIPGQEENQLEVMFKQFGNKRFEEDKWWMAPINWVGKVNDAIETLAKVGAYTALEEKGITGKERANIVRNYVGTPNIRTKGTATTLVNGLFMYLNVNVQGYRADFRLARESKTAGGWWWRYLTANMMPKLLMRAASLGLFGTLMQSWLAMVPDYDKEKYIILPFPPFVIDDGKGGKRAVYIRIPHSDTGRILGSLVWHMTKGPNDMRDLQDMVGAFESELPSVSPALKMLGAWANFAKGVNPYDDWRNEQIISRDAWNAGGWDATEEMIQWTGDQFGVISSMLHPFNGRRHQLVEQTTGELVTGTISRTLQGFVRTSDKGLQEEMWENVSLQDAEAARFRLDLPSSAVALTKERWRLNRLNNANDFTPEQSARREIFNQMYRNVYLPITKSMKAARDAGNTEDYNRLKTLLDETLTQGIRRAGEITENVSEAEKATP